MAGSVPTSRETDADAFVVAVEALVEASDALVVAVEAEDEAEVAEAAAAV